MTPCRCYLCRTHSLPGSEDDGPSPAVHDLSGSEAEDSPASEGGFVELVAVGISSGPPLVSSGVGATFYFDSQADALRFFAEHEIEPPPPYWVKPPLGSEWYAALDQPVGDLLLTFTLRHEG